MNQFYQQFWLENFPLLRISDVVVLKSQNMSVFYHFIFGASFHSIEFSPQNEVLNSITIKLLQKLIKEKHLNFMIFQNDIAYSQK